LPYNLARINSLVLRTDNNTRHNIYIVPRQLYILTALRPHQYMCPDYYYYNLGLGEYHTNGYLSTDAIHSRLNRQVHNIKIHFNFLPIGNIFDG
jgi:hypothetical protein